MATIRKCSSLVRAEKVLAAANALGLPAEVARQFDARAWNNGREQGLRVVAVYVKKATIHTVGVFIAEARGSDATVVVVDENMGGLHADGPSDGAKWTFFRGDDIKAAAIFVNKTLLTMLPAEVL